MKIKKIIRIKIIKSPSLFQDRQKAHLNDDYF